MGATRSGVRDGSTIQVARRLRGGGKCKDKKNQRGRKQAASPKKPEQESEEEPRSDKGPARRIVDRMIE